MCLTSFPPPPLYSCVVGWQQKKEKQADEGGLEAGVLNHVYSEKEMIAGGEAVPVARGAPLMTSEQELSSSMPRYSPREV